MSAELEQSLDPELQAAVDELRGIIAERYPDATFSLSRAEDDPRIVHLNTVVDIEDTEEVVDLVIDRMLELQVEEHLPVYVIPTRPLERLLEERSAASQPRTRHQRAHLTS